VTQSREPQSSTEIEAATVAGAERSRGAIELSPYDPAWPDHYRAVADRARAALGPRLMAIRHAGSTSVPGLSAKPIIDVVATVADSADEPGYAADLIAAGFQHVIREPEWFEHRMFKGAAPTVNLHVFSAGCPEVDRMLLFRDWLRANSADRTLYQSVKEQLAARDWAFVQNYADAKSDVVAEIMKRAEAWAAAGRPVS